MDRTLTDPDSVSSALLELAVLRRLNPPSSRPGLYFYIIKRFLKSSRYHEICSGRMTTKKLFSKKFNYRIAKTLN